MDYGLDDQQTSTCSFKWHTIGLGKSTVFCSARKCSRPDSFPYLHQRNDLDKHINPNHNILISKFADDTKLGKEITTNNDCLQLQYALDKLVAWSHMNGMELHADKCVVLHFGRKNPQYEYNIDGAKLQTADAAKDLGITIQNDCDTTQHVQNISKKAHVILTQIKRSVCYRDTMVLPKIYKTFVRPTLEYAAQVWNPSKIGDVKTLEKVQQRAMRLVNFNEKKSYDEKLEAVGLPTLEARRKRGDLLETFKIINGYSSLEKDMFFNHVQDRHDVETRSHSNNLLVLEQCSLNIRKNFFCCRVVNEWNSLPEYVRQSTSVNNFKNNYDDYLLNII